jgi:hypothetical protein
MHAMNTLTVAAGQDVLDKLPDIEPGVYVTDGTRLYRVLSPKRSLFPMAVLEDCETLGIEPYDADALYTMHLRRVNDLR